MDRGMDGMGDRGRGMEDKGRERGMGIEGEREIDGDRGRERDGDRGREGWG